MLAALREIGDGLASWGLWMYSDPRCSSVDGPVEMGSATARAANSYLVELWSSSPVVGNASKGLTSPLAAVGTALLSTIG